MSSFAADDFEEIGRIVRNRAAERVAQAAALVDGAPVELPQEESAVEHWQRLYRSPAFKGSLHDG